MYLTERKDIIYYIITLFYYFYEGRTKNRLKKIINKLSHYVEAYET